MAKKSPGKTKPTRRSHAQPATLETVTVEIPSVGFVRLATILKLYPISRSAWWEGITAGRYPKPVKLGPRAVGWRVEDIRKLIANGAAA